MCYHGITGRSPAKTGLEKVNFQNKRLFPLFHQRSLALKCPRGDAVVFTQ